MKKLVMKQVQKSLFVLTLLLLCSPIFAKPAAEREQVKPGQVILLRHGQSYMNVERRTSGWGDTHLTEAGRAASLEAGRLMGREGITFDAVYTSYLARAIKTAWLSLEGMDRMWVPVNTSWRLNETEHGAFEGRTRAENVSAWGEERVSSWEASVNVRPPLVASGYLSPADDPRYSAFGAVIPRAESMEDTLIRVRAYWNEVLLPVVRSGKTIMIVGHTNVLRVLSKILDDSISLDEMRNLNIPNTVPIIYTFDENMNTISRQELGN